MRAFKLLKEEAFEEVNPHQQVVVERRERETERKMRGKNNLKDSARVHSYLVDYIWHNAPAKRATESRRAIALREACTSSSAPCCASFSSVNLIKHISTRDCSHILYQFSFC